MNTTNSHLALSLVQTPWIRENPNNSGVAGGDAEHPFKGMTIGVTPVLTATIDAWRQWSKASQEPEENYSEPRILFHAKRAIKSRRKLTMLPHILRDSVYHWCTLSENVLQQNEGKNQERKTWDSKLELTRVSNESRCQHSSCAEHLESRQSGSGQAITELSVGWLQKEGSTS